ncbi:MAG: alpha/beta hydrolase [Alphaproteobacteria bacterium]
MQLEIISRKPQEFSLPSGGKKVTRPKLVFVHGICVGGWIWEKYFLPYFARHGYEAYALSLRGHAKSEGKARTFFWTLADFADDLEQVVSSFKEPVVVVGHSMGGAVVQEWLRTGNSVHKAKGAALLASVPPWGLGYSNMRMAMLHPRVYLEISRMLVTGTSHINEQIMRKALFSKTVSRIIHKEFWRRIENESLVASAEVQGLRPFAPLPWFVKTPMFVGGAADDRFIPASEVYRTASYYGVEAVVVDDLSHSVMFDTNWENMAEPLLSWIGEL